MSEPSSNATVDELFDQLYSAWTAHDADRLADVFAPDCTYEQLAHNLTCHGREQVRSFAEWFFRVEPNLSFRRLASVAAGGRAAAEFAMIEPSGKGVRGASVINVQDGRIMHCTDFFNFVTLLEARGVVTDSMRGRTWPPPGRRADPFLPELPGEGRGPAGPAPDATTVAPMFEDAFAAWQAWDYDRLGALFAADVLNEDVTSATLDRGMEEVRAGAEWNRQIFKHWRLENGQPIAAGGRAACEFTANGVVRAVTLVELVNGRIGRWSDYTGGGASLLRARGVLTDEMLGPWASLQFSAG